jgi:SAM-dependent methyltransferase
VLDEERLAEGAVAMMGERALLDTQAAFDGVAAEYGLSNARNPTLCAMRRRALDCFRRVVPAGSHVLDLGCGPGEDDEALAREGYWVTAIDWSPEMVKQARHRLRPVADRVTVHHLGIHQLDGLALGPFDAAYSSFGPLNCVPDLAVAARQIGGRLRPGAALIASVIGRVCPWEMALYLARGDLARARVRFARAPVPVPLGGRTVWTRYYTPGQFARAFEPAGFARVSLRSLGLLAPPPYLEGFAMRHPRIHSRLHRLDDFVGTWPVLRQVGDHFLIVLRKAC